MIDARGRARTPVTTPGYRRGMKPLNAGRRLPAEPLTRGEVNRLLGTFSRRAPSGVRNRALVVLLWRGGLRIAEALALEPKDIDLDAGTVTVLHGKGDRRRVVGVDPAALAVVERWLVLRRTLRCGRGGPVFCSYSGHAAARGRPLSPGYVRTMVKRQAAKAGIAKRVHPHGFRHTHAVELADEGVPVHLIRAQLGHTDLRTTQRYIDHLAPGQVVAAMQARSWVA